MIFYLYKKSIFKQNNFIRKILWKILKKKIFKKKIFWKNFSWILKFLKKFLLKFSTSLIFTYAANSLKYKFISLMKTHFDKRRMEIIQGKMKSACLLKQHYVNAVLITQVRILFMLCFRLDDEYKKK